MKIHNIRSSFGASWSSKFEQVLVQLVHLIRSFGVLILEHDTETIEEAVCSSAHILTMNETHNIWDASQRIQQLSKLFPLVCC